MPGTEIAIPSYNIDRAIRNADFHTARSTEWAWDLIGWVFKRPEYVEKNPAVIKVCYDAMVRNAKWAEQDIEIEAVEAYRRFMDTGLLTVHDFTKITRHSETEKLLWTEVEKTTDRPEYEPGISAQQAATELVEKMRSLEILGFRINIMSFDLEGITASDDLENAYLYVTFPELKHDEVIIDRDAHGEWEVYPA